MVLNQNSQKKASHRPWFWTKIFKFQNKIWFFSILKKWRHKFPKYKKNHFVWTSSEPIFSKIREPFLFTKIANFRNKNWFFSILKKWRHKFSKYKKIYPPWTLSEKIFSNIREPFFSKKKCLLPKGILNKNFKISNKIGFFSIFKKWRHKFSKYK